MKRLRIVLRALALSLSVAATIAFVTGCAGLNQRPDVPLAAGGPHETATEFDYKLAIVTNHERLQQFIDWEAANPSVGQRVPQIRQLALRIASDLPAKFREVNALHKAYDAIPASAENADILTKARRALTAGLAVLVEYVKLANAAQLRAASPQ